MSNWLVLALTLVLFGSADADIPQANQLRQPSAPAQPAFSPGESAPLFPTTVPAQGATATAPSPAPATRPRAESLQETSKLALIRYVSGEFAKATRPIPGGKDGFILNAGQPLKGDLLDRAVATHGAAINPGDRVQITKLEFRDKTIVVDLNGGGRGKHTFLDHLHLETNGAGMPQSTVTSTNPDGSPTGMIPGAGSTIFLDFPKNIPDLSPDELKGLLAPFLDFSRERSASVHWIDTLPPPMKQAIQDRRPALGMDREMVVAAIGRPEHKVRERDNSGNEIEDWIYGTPPDKTIFVEFTGNTVTSIKQFPQ